MNYAILKAELDAGHPVTLAYDDDDAVAAGQLNAVNCERNRTSMTGSEVLNAVDMDDWITLDAAKKQTVWDVVHLGDINPFGVEATLLISVFGSSATMIALQAVRKESISRATELGLPVIKEGYIQQARTM